MLAFEKLAPFMLRARTVEVGRDRLAQIKNRLAYLLVTEDISENSKNELLHAFKCPIYQCFTSEQIENMFGFRGTKVLGFHRSPLSTSALQLLAQYRIDNLTPGRETHNADKNK